MGVIVPHFLLHGQGAGKSVCAQAAEARASTSWWRRSRVPVVSACPFTGEVLEHQALARRACPRERPKWRPHSLGEEVDASRQTVSVQATPETVEGYPENG